MYIAFIDIDCFLIFSSCDTHIYRMLTFICSIAIYNINLYKIFFNFFMLNIKTSNILFLFFYGLIQFNPCDLRPNFLAKSTLGPGLITAVKIVFYFNFNF